MKLLVATLLTRLLFQAVCPLPRQLLTKGTDIRTYLAPPNKTISSFVNAKCESECWRRLNGISNNMSFLDRMNSVAEDLSDNREI